MYRKTLIILLILDLVNHQLIRDLRLTQLLLMQIHLLIRRANLHIVINILIRITALLRHALPIFLLLGIVVRGVDGGGHVVVVGVAFGERQGFSRILIILRSIFD